MKLMEYQARETFARYGIPVMDGVVIDSLDNIEEKITGLKFPLVVKAQVQVGGRGKAGGIRFAENPAEMAEICGQLLFSELKGHKINKLMIVEKASGKRECYLSVILDRLNKCPMVIFSAEGGVDIEETAVTNPEAIIKIPVDPDIGIKRYMVQYIINKSGIDPEVMPALYDLIKNLYRLFSDTDTLLAEINPLLINEDNTVTPLDGKIDVDDSALYRQPRTLEYRSELQEEELVLEARKFDFLYIPIEEKGDIGVISNGSGMLMSSIDLISRAGMTVGAALDLGGGATADRIREAVRIVLSNNKIHSLFINIFGGITRCNEVAEGVNAAMALQPKGKYVVVRLEGTNKEEGISILKSSDSDILSVDGLAEGVAALAERRVVQ
jgi:succinyl-CoA synthetase beta subunit